MSGTNNTTATRLIWWLGGLLLVIVAAAGLCALSPVLADAETDAPVAPAATATGAGETTGTEAGKTTDAEAGETAGKSSASASDKASDAASTASAKATPAAPAASAAPAAAAAAKDAAPAAKIVESLPSRSVAPRATTAPAASAITPTTFTVSGKKRLVGRTLHAGEFSFRIAAAGVAVVPARSGLAEKLKPGSGLSDAEKYELVAHGDLVYYPASNQPLPESTVVGNGADGSVAFAPMTFTGASLGEAATHRHMGVVFCYTVSEQPPLDENGALLEGAVRNDHGQYVYQGITYDDSIKRIYLYAYETRDEAGASQVNIVPLGDASFSGVAPRAQTGQGTSFVNTFSGASLPTYDGYVYLEGDPIDAGEFNFDVREVTEDGTLLADDKVACTSSAGGSVGAGVAVISDQTYTEPGKYFYAISQAEPATDERSNVVLDKTAYVITVQVDQTSQGGLDASITYVRKKDAATGRWVDVSPETKPSAVLWQNELVRDGQPDDGMGDKPDGGGDETVVPGTPSIPGGSNGADETPGVGGGTAGTPGAPGGSGGTGADKPGDVAKPEAGGTGAGSGTGSASDGSGGTGGSDSAGSAAGGANTGTDTGGNAGTMGNGTGTGTGNSGGTAPAPAKPTAGSFQGATPESSVRVQVSSASLESTESAMAMVRESGSLAQTGDDALAACALVALVLVVSAIVIVVASRKYREQER